MNGGRRAWREVRAAIDGDCGELTGIVNRECTADADSTKTIGDANRVSATL